jgi:hypothetical protein
MHNRLTDAQLIDTLGAVQLNPTDPAVAARALGISVRTLRNRLADAKARGLKATSKVVDPLDKANALNARLQAEVVGLRREAIEAEQVREQLYGLASIAPEPPAWMVRAGAANSKTLRTPGVPMTIWSDWHWGETVSRQETGGANEFNAEVARRRVRTLVDKTISLAKDHMVNPKYPGIVVALGGDMITGAIHDELVATNWGTVQEQFLEVEEELITALGHMADAFGKVFVPCVVGNHGRGTLKPRYKGAIHMSYEWNLYTHLERWFAKDRRFRFLVPNETDAYFKVYNHRFLLTHGDNLGVKGGDGIIGAIGPIARGTMKVGRSEARIGRDFDTLLMGHYHTYIGPNDAVPVIVNGSVIGYNEYARLGLRVPYSRPSQALWFVHPDHGVTAAWQVYLDKLRDADVKPEWLTFQQR